MLPTSESSIDSASPSSSAVTIPVPGKSILKRPPAPTQSLFSRITRFLPTSPAAPPANNAEEPKVLKRAHFILPQIATVYPISSINPPSTPTLKDERKAIEEREAERRKRVVRGNKVGPGIADTEEWWDVEKVESFYKECCEGCEELPDAAIATALKNAKPNHSRSLDLSGIQLNLTSSSILSDVFSIEWGLRKLVFRECDLDEYILKPMLHSLLIPGTLEFLSVSSNRRLKAPAFRLIGAYMEKATALEFLDLSQNSLDKKSIEYVVAALTTAPLPGLASLRLDDCTLRPAALEVLARAVRTSSLRNISLRHNKITATGAVALALMIRDYPDVVPSTPTLMSPSVSSNGPNTPDSSVPPSPALSAMTLPLSAVPPLSNDNSAPSSPTLPPNGPLLPLPPPPRHPPTGPQTTYTPYVPRSKARRVGTLPSALALPPQNGMTVSNGNSPSSATTVITSSSRGGVTARNVQGANAQTHNIGPSAALLDKVRALDSLPRLGALRTLDLRGNDLRGGITYIAQVLKRNRTLKVLNLSENKLDVGCLVVIAEALKYNSCLETLDLSKNPCSGPGLEGIQSLRTAFTLNTALKRLFLSSTHLTSPGAIALAEFLPESHALLHLDLTSNDLSLAGVMALAKGLTGNHVIRCLDLNIPPGDEAFAQWSRQILGVCVRNTESAERGNSSDGTPNGSIAESARGSRRGVWGMIEESELAKSIKLEEDTKVDADVLTRAQSCITQMHRVMSVKSLSTSTESPTVISSRAKAILSELANVIPATEDMGRLQMLLDLNDELTSLLSRLSLTPTANVKPTLTLGTNGLHHASDEESEDEEVVMTPRIDKGKGKAPPEPIQVERVLSPTTSMSLFTEEEGEEEEGEAEFDPDDDTELIQGGIGSPSPTDRSRIWVEEEGEVFRKGTVLLGPEEMEGEFAGDELRIELLEAMVERPPPRPLNDGFSSEPGLPPATIMEAQVPLPSSPAIGSLPPAFVPESPAKTAPRPYISRSRSSSSSIMSLIAGTGNGNGSVSPNGNPFPRTRSASNVETR